MESDDAPDPTPDQKPYHGFKSSEPRDKKGRWVVRVVPVAIPQAIVPLIPPVFLRRDPAPPPAYNPSDDISRPTDTASLTDSPISAWGCVLVLLALAGMIGGILWYFANQQGP
jgi:hypothetical protein